MIVLPLLFALAAVPSQAFYRYQIFDDLPPRSTQELQVWAEAKKIADSEAARPVRELVAAAPNSCEAKSHISIDARGIICGVLKELWQMRLTRGIYNERVLIPVEALARWEFHPRNDGKDATQWYLQKGSFQMNLMVVYHIVEMEHVRRVRAARVKKAVDAGIPR